MIKSLRRWVPVLGVAGALVLAGPGVAGAAPAPAGSPAPAGTAVRLVPLARAATPAVRTPAQPGSAQPGSAQLGSARSASAQPGSTRPGSAQPRAGRPGPVQTQDLPCRAGQDWENRFEICRSIGLAAVVTQINSNGAVVEVGRSNFLATHHIVMNPNSRTLADNLTLTFTTGSGDIAGLGVTIIGAGCGTNCSGAVSWSPNQPATPGSVAAGVVVFSSLGLDTVLNQGAYQVVFPKPNATSPPGIWNGPAWRCDSAISIVGGCVNFAYIPTMTSMATLPNIAASIRAIQSAGPHHYGRPGFGTPLNRTADGALADRNYTAACGGRTAPAPSLSCDEYPFKTTYQGASRTAVPDWGFAWVPISEQNSQGGLISSFYQGQRILDGDAFWVLV